MYRVGIGTDIHAFTSEAPMWLAGINFPEEPFGLSGHSDGDVACHAACDALFSAAGLGDMGSNFGVDDPNFENARGVFFLQNATKRLQDHGFKIINVGIQIIGNRPKIALVRKKCESLLSDVVQAPVTVSATTSDGLGLTGRGEGVAAFAVALVDDEACRP